MLALPVGQNTRHQLMSAARELRLSRAGLNERALDWNRPPGADFKLEARCPEHSWGSMTLQQGQGTFSCARGRAACSSRPHLHRGIRILCSAGPGEQQQRMQPRRCNVQALGMKACPAFTPGQCVPGHVGCKVNGSSG